MTRLSPRQQAIYDYILGFVEEFGRQPTYRSLMRQFGMTSPNGIMSHLRAMAQKGWITLPANGEHGVGFIGWKFKRIAA